MESINRAAPLQDEEISNDKAKCLKRYFSNSKERGMVNMKFAKFPNTLEAFSDNDSLRDRGIMNPKHW